MDALEQAKLVAEHMRETHSYEGDSALALEATAFAAIAQAEQLKRIADALYGTYPQSETETSLGNILKDIALDVSGIAMKPTR